MLAALILILGLRAQVLAWDMQLIYRDDLMQNTIPHSHGIWSFLAACGQCPRHQGPAESWFCFKVGIARGAL